MIRPSVFVALLSGCLMAPQSGRSTQPSTTAVDNTAEPTASTPSSSTPGAPAGPQTVSVTIRSSCSKTAKVFYGEKPGFSSGTQRSVSSNSVENKTFRVGDQMWVVDDGGKPLGNVRIEPGTRQIEIASSCTALSAR